MPRWTGLFAGFHRFLEGLRTGAKLSEKHDGMDAIRTEGLTKHYQVGFWRPRPYLRSRRL